MQTVLSFRTSLFLLTVRDKEAAGEVVDLAALVSLPKTFRPYSSLRWILYDESLASAAFIRFAGGAMGKFDTVLQLVLDV